MKKFGSYTGLTLTALFTRSLMLFPGWLLMLDIEKKDMPVLGCCAVLVLFYFLIAAALRVLRVCYSGRVLLRRIFSAAALLAGTAGCAAVLWCISGRLWLSLVSAVLAGMFALPCAAAEPDKLVQPNDYAVFLTAMLLIPPVLKLAGKPVQTGLVLGMIAAVTALFLLLRNQFMLLRLVNRRSNGESAVPVYIRRGNLRMLCGVLLLPAVLMLFHEPVAAGMRACGHALLEVLSAVVSALARFVNRIAGDPPDALSRLPEGDPQELVRGTRSPLWNLLWIPFGAVTLYFMRIFLWDWLCGFAGSVQEFFVRLIKRHDGESRVRAVSGAYEDIETAVDARKTAAQKKRGWKKAYRAWLAQTDTREKFYAGYGLLLAAPCWEPQVQDSETVREIRRRWAGAHDGADTLAAVTEAFHADRYAGEGLPENALEEMKAVLHTVSRWKA